MDYYTTYKTVLLGQSSVGKSSVADRFVNGNFKEFSSSTIGAAFLVKKLEINSQKIRLEVWDTAGQLRYRSLAPLYYRNAHIALIVYDITDSNSYEAAKNWVNELEHSCDQPLIIAIVGNKVDLDSERKVLTKGVQDYCNENNFIFMEVSAKTSQNIDLLFETISISALKRINSKFRNLDRVFPEVKNNTTNSCC